MLPRESRIRRQGPVENVRRLGPRPGQNSESLADRHLAVLNDRHQIARLARQSLAKRVPVRRGSGSQRDLVGLIERQAIAHLDRQRRRIVEDGAGLGGPSR